MAVKGLKAFVESGKRKASGPARAELTFSESPESKEVANRYMAEAERAGSPRHEAASSYAKMQSREVREGGFREHSEARDWHAAAASEHRAHADKLRSAGKAAEANKHETTANAHVRQANRHHEQHEQRDAEKAHSRAVLSKYYPPEEAKRMSELPRGKSHAARVKPLQRGKKGGQFYMSEHGQKVYVGKK